MIALANDIFRLATLFIPLHINGNHWASIVVDFTNHTIAYLDSMNGNSHPHVDRILHFLQLEHQAVHKCPLPDWEFIAMPTPQQINNNDCGVYTCFFANRVLQRASLQVSPESISTFREHIAISIVTNTASLG
jgi:Ulp1 family protease